MHDDIKFSFFTENIKCLWTCSYSGKIYCLYDFNYYYLCHSQIKLYVYFIYFMIVFNKNFPKNI